MTGVLIDAPTLVERLRSRVSVTATPYGNAGPDDQLCVDAADEIERLQALVDGRFKDAAKAYLLHAGPDGKGNFEFAIQSGIVPLIAAHLVEAFKAQGGENYVSIEVNTEELGPLELVMQRRLGETPAQVAAKQRERAEKAERELAELHASYTADLNAMEEHYRKERS